MLSKLIRIAIVATLFLLPGRADAQTKLLRFPDIHGDKVIFTYGGDLWAAAADGRDGDAAHDAPRHRGLRKVFARRQMDRLYGAV